MLLKEKVIINALRLMELLVTDHEQNRRACVELIHPILEYFGDAIEILHPIKKASDKSRKNVPEKRVQLKPMPRVFVIDLLNRLAAVLSRIVRGSVLVCNRHLGESEISQIFDFIETILEAQNDDDDESHGNEFSIVTKLLDVILEWPAPTPYCGRPTPILQNQKFVLQELKTRRDLQQFLILHSKHPKVKSKAELLKLNKNKQENEGSTAVAGNVGGRRTRVKEKRLRSESIFSICAEDMEPEEGRKTTSNYKDWTIRIRSKIASILQVGLLSR